jgi:uncharacterized protein YcfJ
MKNRNWIVGAGALFALAIAAPVSANHDEPGSYARDGAVYDYARVLSAEPIVRYVTVETPVRECWEDTEYEIRTHRVGGVNPVGSTVVGGLIGGVIGNQIGDGHGRDAMTVFGTLVGAAIGSDHARKHNAISGGRVYETTEYARPVRRCATRVETHEEQRIDGYRVVYVYNNQRYATRLPEDPGKQLRIRVDVRPAI